MPRFAANLSVMFSDLPYVDRFDAAAAAGFEAVEILFPYDWPGQDTRNALIKNALDLVLINGPPPNYTGGTAGYAAIPDGEGRFKSDFRRVMRYADLLKPGLIHLMAGYASGATALDMFVWNLQWAADQRPLQRFTIEPLNPYDEPGYFLNDYALAHEVLSAVDRANVGLQYDSYHAHRIHGDALRIWETYGREAVHVQVSDAPVRGAPYTGEIDFHRLFEAIDASGYDGWVSGEYNPGKDTEQTLAWIR